MLNKEKYDLNTLKIEWSPQVFEKRLFTIKLKSDERTIFSKEMTPTETGTSAYNAWLEEEYDPKILTDEEKAYLSAVIKPYRHSVMRIKKGSIQGYSQEWITIEYSDETNRTYGHRIATLPNFKFGTMYKGMEANKLYTLKELGL